MKTKNELLEKDNNLKNVIETKLETAKTLRTQALNTIVEKAKKVEEKREKAIKTLENKENLLKAVIDKKLESA